LPISRSELNMISSFCKAAELSQQAYLEEIPQTLKEFRNFESSQFKIGDEVKVDIFQIGDKVKVSVIFKGRELAYTEIGENLLKKFIERLSEVAKVEQEPKFEGRAMHAILAPSKGKKKK